MTKPLKIPVSVLVVIHSQEGQILLLERADHAGFWQSVTGSLNTIGEAPRIAAQREVQEETGLVRELEHFVPSGVETEYDIFPEWRHRYASGVTRNLEITFTLCVPQNTLITIAPREHLRYEWCPAHLAASRCFSPSNQAAILALAQKMGWQNKVL